MSSLINSLLTLICMLILVIRIFVAGRSLVVWYEVISLYDCEMNFIWYPVHWLILYLLRSVCCFFHLNNCSWYAIVFLTSFEFCVWLWNDYYLIPSSLINSLHAFICILFLSIWIIAAGMLVAVFTRSNLSVYLWNLH